LKIETQPLEGHQVQLTVEIEPSVFEEAKIRAAKKIARKVKIPGFRPGKAPYAVILRYAGEESITEEAMEVLIDDVYPKVIEESGIEPYGPGKLNEIKGMEPPVLEFIVPLKATVELGDYLSVKIPYELKEISDQEVEDVITRLLDQQAIIEAVERPAAEGDLVVVSVKGEKLGVDGDASLIDDRAVTINIKTETDDSTGEWPFPGFSRKLVGLSVNDERSFEYSYSDDYTYESLRGVAAKFDIHVNEVKSRSLPEVNDEFAQSVGEFASLDDLRTQIRKDLETHALQDYHDNYDQKVIEEIIGLSTIKFPDMMLDREVEDVIDQLKNRLQRQNMDLDLYLKTRKMDMEALKVETRPVAEKRLKRTLTLLELAEVENIKLDPGELQAETTRTLDQFARVMPEKDFRKLTARDGTSNLIGNIMMEMVIDKTLERIRSLSRGIAPEAEAIVEELPVSVDETDEPISEPEIGETASTTTEE